jgi:tRNA modification GTPase
MAALDTIVAIATAPGRGAVGIVRVSGPEVPRLAELLLGALPPPRRATLAPGYRPGAVLPRTRLVHR